MAKIASARSAGVRLGSGELSVRGVLPARRADLRVFPGRQAFSGQDPSQTGPAATGGILRLGQTGTGLGGASTEDKPGRCERAVCDVSEPGDAGRLCESHRQASARKSEEN